MSLSNVQAFRNVFTDTATIKSIPLNIVVVSTLKLNMLCFFCGKVVENL